MSTLPFVRCTVSPMKQVAAWLDEARKAPILEPEAMALATATRTGVPSVRIVLCRGIDDDSVRFFTNYESRKASELEANPVAAVAFHWEALYRQVRIEGSVTRLSAAESDAYFASRPRGSQISASVSPQSRTIDGLEELERRRVALDAELQGRAIPRPANWGGYRLRASMVELWTAGANRFHERRRFDRDGEGWVESRLAP